MSLTESKTYVQYKYCPLCSISCKKLKKHTHSEGHQKIVRNILSKFSKKVSDAKVYIDKPVVKDVTWNDADKQLWCYYCQCDVSQHLRKITMKGECIVISGGFLGHMTREDHVNNTAKFLKDNSVDMKRTPEFILPSESFLKFMEIVEKTCSDFFSQKELAMKKVAASIRAQNVFRHHVIAEGLLEQSLSQQNHNLRTYTVPKEDSGPNSFKSQEVGEPRGKKTVKAFGVGLTVVERLNEDDTQGNIHSNAVPPWLRADAEEAGDKTAAIGPSLADFQKQKKLEIKKQLPAGRVGAKFDRKASLSTDWLPNFGGVWNHGPRTKAGQQFLRRQNYASSNFKAFPKNSPETSISIQSGSSVPLHMRASTSTSHDDLLNSISIEHYDPNNVNIQSFKPYISKRKRKAVDESVPNVISKSQFVSSQFSQNVSRNASQPVIYTSIPSTISEECSSFSSTLKDQSYSKASDPWIKDKMQSFSALDGHGLKYHLPYNTSIQLLSTPVLNVKKK